MMQLLPPFGPAALHTIAVEAKLSALVGEFLYPGTVARIGNKNHSIDAAPVVLFKETVPPCCIRCKS